MSKTIEVIPENWVFFSLVFTSAYLLISFFTRDFLHLVNEGIYDTDAKTKWKDVWLSVTNKPFLFALSCYMTVLYMEFGIINEYSCEADLIVDLQTLNEKTVVLYRDSKSMEIVKLTMPRQFFDENVRNHNKLTIGYSCFGNIRNFTIE